MSIYGLLLPGWQNYSTWGAETDLATGGQHFYAQLSHNDHGDDAGPQFWISPPRHPPYRTVIQLAGAISSITTADPMTVLQAMSAGVDPQTRRALLLPEPQAQLHPDQPQPPASPPAAGIRKSQPLEEGPAPSEGAGWRDLATNPPGIGVTYEAARRRQVDGAGADRSWRVGADGEFEVADLLSTLTSPSRWDRLRGRQPRWFVLHSVPLGDGHGRIRGDVDHLMIGPPGVVSINTKHHRTGKLRLIGDELTLNGYPTEYVPKARREAQRVDRLLRQALGGEPLVLVRPLIVIVGGRLLVEGWPSGVTVVMTSRLIEALRAFPPILDPAQVRKIYEMARRSTTWNLEL